MVYRISGNSLERIPSRRDNSVLGYDHKNYTDRVRETSLSLYPGHAVAEGGEPGDDGLGICRSNEPDDDIADGDHVLDLHPEQSPDTIPGKIREEVPEIPKIRDHETGREEPDTGLDDADIGSKVGMALADIDRADSLERSLNDTGNEDNER